MAIVQIIDFALDPTTPRNLIAMNRGQGNFVRSVDITGISGQTLTVQKSNDGINWKTMTDDKGNPYKITTDDSFPFYKGDYYLQIISDIDPTGITVTVGMNTEVVDV